MPKKTIPPNSSRLGFDDDESTSEGEEKKKDKTSIGDTVLITYLDPNRPDIAQRAGAMILNSDSDSASQPEDEDEDGYEDHRETLSELSSERAKVSLTWSPPSPFSRKGRLLDLPIIISNVEHSAIPDTGATINAISYAALDRLNPKPVIALEDDLHMPESCRVGDGKTADVIGEVELDWAFPDKPQDVQSIVFKVYDALAAGVHVVVGKGFLEKTQTLTKFASRLVERTRLPTTLPRLMHLTPSTTHMRIYVDSILAYACADTGSELDLISPNYAQARGFEILDLEEEEDTHAQLADGRIVPLAGKVRVKIDVLSKETNIETIGRPARDSNDKVNQSSNDPLQNPALARTRNFYVLRGLPYNLLLGQALLDSMDAFAVYQHAFGENVVMSELYGIFKVTPMQLACNRLLGKKRKRIPTSLGNKPFSSSV